MDSYADWLRARDDEELRAMLAARPELTVPVPVDMGALAARAATVSACARAVDRLDLFSVSVLEALVALPEPIPYTTLRRTLVAGIEPSIKITERHRVIRSTVDRLRVIGLIWGPDRRLRTAPGVGRALPQPAGLGPPIKDAFAGYQVERLTELLVDLGAEPPAGFADAERLAERLGDLLADPSAVIEDAGPEAGTALEQLVWGPPVGRVENARRPVRLATATTPIERLLARGLLAATDDRTVTLPREIALWLRTAGTSGTGAAADTEAAGDTAGTGHEATGETGRGHESRTGRQAADHSGRTDTAVPPLFRALQPMPPPLDGKVRDTTMIDRMAAGHAFTTVRLIADLLERWGTEPPPVLRSGGLGVRDLKATASRLELPEWHAVLLIEVAFAAGLLARSGGVDGDWLPTRGYDLWLLRDTAERWAALATAWTATDRVPGLAGERDDRDRLINALTDDSIRAAAPESRRSVLETLADAEPGTAPEAAAIRERLAWLRPRRRGALQERMIDWTLREAEVLGFTGFGAIGSYARLLVTGRSGQEAVPALAGLLPEPVDQVLIQADLTAVAPGPLVTTLARELALMADVESTGGATVYRFTAASVRRALDAGRSAAELTDLLARHSATPVPQPLTYLIEDMARRHGRLRVGTASAYVRTDDPAVLDEIIADRRAESLFLHRLAPTVLASRLARTELLDGLRAMGLTPVAESAEGGVVIMRMDAQRAESPRTGEAVRMSGGDPAMIAAAVRALKAGEEAARHGVAFARQRPEGPSEPPRSASPAMVGDLRQAVERGGRVWIGYLDQQGQASSRIVEPIRVEGGYLTAFDATRAAVHRFTLHRITGVAEVGTEAGGSPTGS